MQRVLIIRFIICPTCPYYAKCPYYVHHALGHKGLPKTGLEQGGFEDTTLHY